MKAQYWIAQYIDDLFRNEPRNIGIIARVGDQIAAQFVGESESGEIDGRKLKLFKYPEVYREWLQYWRRMINRGSLDKLFRESKSNFRVNEGGHRHGHRRRCAGSNSDLFVLSFGFIRWFSRSLSR